jgi:hypothetical protein
MQGRMMDTHSPVQVKLMALQITHHVLREGPPITPETNSAYDV